MGRPEGRFVGPPGPSQNGPKIGQKSIFERPEMRSIFSMLVRSILERQLEPKRILKFRFSTVTSSKIILSGYMDRWCGKDRFWEDFGTIFGPVLEEKRFKGNSRKNGRKKVMRVAGVL